MTDSKMREALLAAKKIIANPHGYTETSVLVAEALIGQAAQPVPGAGKPVKCMTCTREANEVQNEP